MKAKPRRAVRARPLPPAGWIAALPEATTAGLFVWRGRLLYANRALAQLLGYTPEELVALPAGALLPPGSRAELLAGAERFLAGEGDPQATSELPLRGKDGRERWVEVTASRVELDDGTAVVGTVVDVSDRVATSRALAESEAWFRTLAETTSTAIFVFRDRFLYANPAAAQLTGYSVEELLALDPLDLVHPDFRELVAERRRARLAGEPVPSRYEMLLITRSGEERWIDFTGGTIPFRGQVAGLGSAFDITDRKAADFARRKSDERLNLAQRAARVVTWDWNLLTDELVVSETAREALEGVLDPVPTTTRDFFDRIVHPEDRPRVVDAVRRAIRDGQEYSVEHRCLAPGGRVRWLAERGQAIRDESGWVVRMLGVSIDVSDRKQIELALRDSEERAQVILAAIDDGVIRTDARGVVEYLNPVAERVIGMSCERARGRPLEAIYRVVDEASKKPLLNPVSRCLREGRRVILPGERMLVCRDGSEVAIRDSAAPIQGHGGEVLGAVLAFKDLTAVRHMERAVTHLANHDGLTGLLNRPAFERRLARGLAESAVSGRSLGVLQLDLAQLKVVNDTCGHLAGDELVKQAARHLVTVVGDEHALARLGAEEFGLLLEGTTAEEARARAAELRAAFEGFRFDWQEMSFEVRVGIGLVVAGPGDSVSGLLIAVDIACMLAKESGRNRIHEYQGQDERLAERYREMHWIHRIYKALERQSFRLYCQPVRRLGGEEDGLLAEVLLRMVGEDGELVLPRTFVPAAERYRLMSSIDRWVVAKSFELLAGEATVGGQRIDRLAVNLSGESLNDESFLDYVVERLVASEVAGSRVLFEITETAAIANLQGAMRFIAELQRLGVGFVLDDFGSGLSSFAYLKNLPVDYLKISSEFIRDIDAVPLQRTLVRSINQVGHELGLSTIAEGVESEAILAVVRDIQLDYAQGYWIAPPQPLLPGSS